MKEFVKVTIGYSYEELDEAAKERVKEWYLEDEIRVDLFYDDIRMMLDETFPNSKLDAQFSLNYCQGDGLNIYGELNLFDFLDYWDASDKEVRRMRFYLEYCSITFRFSSNNHYCYSYKFADAKEIDSYVFEDIDNLEVHEIRDIDESTIRKFYTDLFDYFEDLDRELEKRGYDYLYDCDDEEVKEACEANDWYFTKEGKFICCG
jgi:hypothetical protein